jgi:hypothetical protein
LQHITVYKGAQLYQAIALCVKGLLEMSHSDLATMLVFRGGLAALVHLTRMHVDEFAVSVCESYQRHVVAISRSHDATVMHGRASCMQVSVVEALRILVKVPRFHQAFVELKALPAITSYVPCCDSWLEL